jgi:hypothetical protein
VIQSVGMDYFVHPLAQEEIDEVIAFYDNVDQNLGDDFLVELQSAISRLLQFPEAWQKVTPSARRCLFNRFPLRRRLPAKK